MKAFAILLFAICTCFAADERPWKPTIEFHENYLVARSFAWHQSDDPMTAKPGLGSGISTYIRYDSIDSVSRDYFLGLNGYYGYFIIIQHGGDVTRAGFKVGSKEYFDIMFKYFDEVQDIDVVEKAFGK